MEAGMEALYSLCIYFEQIQGTVYFLMVQIFSQWDRLPHEVVNSPSPRGLQTEGRRVICQRCYVDPAPTRGWD